MALQNKTASTGKLYILKIKTKDAADKKVPAYIQVSEKVGEKWVANGNTVNSVSGDLTKVEIREREFQGEKYNSIGLFFTDKTAKETYLLDTRFNMVSQGLFNSLFSLEAFNNVEVQVYDNKAGYATTSVTQDGKKVSWKYGIDELPKVKKITAGKKTLTDTSELEEFFLTHLNDLNNRIQATKGRGKTETVSAAQEPSDATPETDEDVPF